MWPEPAGPPPDPAGMIALRAGVLEQVQLPLEDGQHARVRLADTEQRMTAVLDEFGLTALVTSTTGLSAVGAAANPGRYRRPDVVRDGPRVVKHAGLVPDDRGEIRERTVRDTARRNVPAG